MSTAFNTNSTPTEIAKFNQLANTWWNPRGAMRLLHQLNPVRLSYVSSKTNIKDQKILDIGCGAGIFAESLARLGGVVTGLDLAPDLILAAQHHAKNQDLALHYVCQSLESFATEHPQTFDSIVCMEMLEHVEDPAATIAQMTHLLKPGGHLFLSTLNKTPRSFLEAIIGAEYVLGWLPKGTHDWRQFITPYALTQMLKNAQLTLRSLQGIGYNPLLSAFYLQPNVSVNYLVHAQRPL